MDNSHASVAEQRRYWQRHVAQWSRSGQSARAYCQAAGVCPKQFTAWRQRLRREGGRRRSEAPALIPVEVRPSAEACAPALAPTITVRLSSGLGIEVSSGFDAATLQAVIKALGAGDVLA